MIRCLIPGCPHEPDPGQGIETRIPEPPYVEIRRACPSHLESLRAIGLPVREVKG